MPGQGETLVGNRTSMRRSSARTRRTDGDGKVRPPTSLSRARNGGNRPSHAAERRVSAARSRRVPTAGVPPPGTQSAVPRDDDSVGVGAWAATPSTSSHLYTDGTTVTGTLGSDSESHGSGSGSVGQGNGEG